MFLQVFRCYASIKIEEKSLSNLVPKKASYVINFLLTFLRLQKLNVF